MVNGKCQVCGGHHYDICDVLECYEAALAAKDAEIERLMAENAAFRRQVGLEGQDLDGYLAVGIELIRRDREIERLQVALDEYRAAWEHVRVVAQLVEGPWSHRAETHGGSMARDAERIRHDANCLAQSAFRLAEKVEKAERLFVENAALRAEVERLREAYEDGKMREDRDYLLGEVERLSVALAWAPCRMAGRITETGPTCAACGGTGCDVCFGLGAVCGTCDTCAERAKRKEAGK